MQCVPRTRQTLARRRHSADLVCACGQIGFDWSLDRKHQTSAVPRSTAPSPPSVSLPRRPRPSLRRQRIHEGITQSRPPSPQCVRYVHFELRQLPSRRRLAAIACAAAASGFAHGLNWALEAYSAGPNRMFFISPGRLHRGPLRKKREDPAAFFKKEMKNPAQSCLWKKYQCVLCL